ncbi:MAG: flagellar hook-basal body complex protein FliE [Proteobacteria bacterium]|nr:flagellar hook-basal body complex protein FliE [Pseudomonadota bacterium]MBU1059947.1 flagellar hook-basal body complex protein FliE [Pseudomonadota bacterium]
MNPITLQINSTPLPLAQPDSHPVAKAGSDFSKMIKSSIDMATNAEQQSNAAINKLNSGEAKNLHEVMIAVEEADISLKMLVQFRNKALQAYDDIMRLQI